MVLVGCLDGRVHECEVGGATMEVLHLEGSVLHMQFSHQFKVGFVYEKSHTYTRCNLFKLYIAIGKECSTLLCV